MDKEREKEAATVPDEIFHRKHKQRLSVAQTQAIVDRNTALANIFKPKKKEIVDDDANGEGIVNRSRQTASIVEDSESMSVVNKIKEKKRNSSWTGSHAGDETVDDVSSSQRLPNAPNSTLSATKKEKRRLAVSLATLAANPEARISMVKKGAIGVLINMSTTPDRSVQRSCVMAFSALSKEPSIRAQMIEEGSMAAIVSLLSIGNNTVVFEACRALCNLCIEPMADIRAIKDGVPFALMHSLSTFPNCIDVCLRAYLNLSCVPEKYPRIEEISDALMHFNNYALSTENEILIASALCNLSALKSFQLRLVEDGCLRFVERIVKSFDVSLRMLGGRIIDNLTTDSRTRSKMVDNGIIVILLQMSKDDSVEVRTSSVRSFYNLSLSDSCRVRIVNANAVKVIVQICSDKIQNVNLGRIASRILQLLCSDSRIVLKLVKDGIIKALMNLLLSDDEVICQKCAESICSLFQIEEVKTKLIEQGAVSILVKLSDSMTMQVTGEWISFALFHLAVSTQCPLNVIQAAILPCVIKLCDTQNSPNTKYFCAATLSHISQIAEINLSSAIPILVYMLKSDDDKKDMKALCANALFNLTNVDQNCHIMLEFGALIPVVRLTAMGDRGTKMKCAAILSRLSIQTEFHSHFATGDVLKVLLELSNIDDIYTQRKVIIAISNLCQSDNLRNQLVTLNPIQYLMTLAAKCDEHVRRGCASIVCNLAMAPNSEKAIAKTGIVETLLIIAMITSDQLSTKVVCVKALVNLMADPSLYASMVEKGLIWGLSSLANLDSAEIKRLCLTALTTLSKEFSKEMLSSTPCIRTVARAVEQSEDIELTRYGVRTMFNLLIKSTDNDLDFRKLAVNSMRQLIQCPDIEISETCLMCMCLASQSESCRDDIVRVGLLNNIDANSILTSNRICSAYLTMFENIALNPNSRDNIVDEKCVSRFMQICSLSNRELNNATGRALYCISCNENNIPNLINQDVIALINLMMVEIDYEGPDEELSKLLIATLYNFSTVESCQALLIQQKIVKTLLALWEYALEDFLCCSLVITIVAHLATGNINSNQLLKDGAARMLSFVGQAAQSSYPACMFEFELVLLERVSAAFRNLLCVVSNHEYLVASGCVPVIINLASQSKMLIEQAHLESPLLQRSTLRNPSNKLPSIESSKRQSSNPLLPSKTMTTSTFTHSYKRAQPEHTVILNNCISALRSLTFNPSYRQLLVDSGAMEIILEGDFDGIPLMLLVDLEKESWQNGSRGLQKETRVYTKPGAMFVSLLGGTKKLDVDDVIVITPKLDKYYVGVNIEELEKDSVPVPAAVATDSLGSASPLGSARSVRSGVSGTISPRARYSSVPSIVAEPSLMNLALGINDLKKYHDADDTENAVMSCGKVDANDCELKLNEPDPQDDQASPSSPSSPNIHGISPQSPYNSDRAKEGQHEGTQPVNASHSDDEDSENYDAHPAKLPIVDANMPTTAPIPATPAHINPNAVGSALSVPMRRLGTPADRSRRPSSALDTKKARDRMVKSVMRRYSQEAEFLRSLKTNK